MVNVGHATDILTTQTSIRIGLMIVWDAGYIKGNMKNLLN